MNEDTKSFTSFTSKVTLGMSSTSIVTMASNMAIIAKLEQACSGDCWGTGSQGDRLVPKSYLLGSSRELGCQGTVAQQACSL